MKCCDCETGVGGAVRWVALLLLSAGAMLVVGGGGTAGEAPRGVACLGKLVPGDGIVEVAGAYTLQGPPVVLELAVKRGDRVNRGQVLARLQHFPVTLAQVGQAEAERDWYASQVEQVRAGAKSATVQAQGAVVTRLRAEADLAEVELRRQEALFEQKALSQSELDSARLELRKKRQDLEQGGEELAALQEVRAVDVEVAAQRLKLAEAMLMRARAEHEMSLVTAPMDGVVLGIQALPGERLDTKALLSLGDIDRMRVEAEVHVTDLPRVRTGARVAIEGDGFEGVVNGEVREIGLEAQANRLFDPNPTAFADRRVVKVWIDLSEAGRVRGLSGSMVRVRIQP